MRIFNLIRISDIDDGTFGVFLDYDIPFCLTLERRWLDNKRGESCIPWGNFICQRVQSPKFGETFQVLDVPGRSGILFHKGNINDDSHGCILLGEQFEPINGKNGILASGKAFQEFMQRTHSIDNFVLKINKLGQVGP